MKKTDWFPAGVKPVREGLYECKYANGNTRLFYWTGECWTYASIHAREWATMWGNGDSDYSREFWRGLTEKAE